MRTMEERERLIHKRTAELRREKQKQKQLAIDVVSIAACLVLVIGAAIWMPGYMERITEVTVSHSSGAASILGNHTALGYILIATFSFLLGMSVTVLLYRLRMRMNRKQEDGTDEL